MTSKKYIRNKLFETSSSVGQNAITHYRTEHIIVLYFGDGQNENIRNPRFEIETVLYRFMFMNSNKFRVRDIF